MMKIPKIVEAYYPELIWRMPSDKKEIFLTFDDGPTPYVTKWVLDVLKDYNAKATFFCVGKNVKNHPIIFKRILREGHRIGNHTYDHKNGWSTANFNYIKSVMKCDKYVSSDLFRPPYGRIKRAQIKRLVNRFHIVMWDVLSEDYNQSISAEKCAQIVLSQTKEGSIVVFHDSRKAAKNLKFALPQLLDHFSLKGYSFLGL